MDNLDFVYIGFYFQDIYGTISTALGWTIAFAVIASVVLVCYSAIAADEQAPRGEGFALFKQLLSGFKPIFKKIGVVFVTAIILQSIIPSEDTIKAYIGTKAAQAIDEGDKKVPERAKNVMNKMWDTIDTTVSTIEFD